MAVVASFSVSHEKRTMPIDSQTRKTYIPFIKKIHEKISKKKISRHLAAILIIGGNLKF